MSMITKWNPRKLKRAITDQLERNAEPTGIFLQRQAKTRLMAIQNPEWGQAYRRKILARLIIHEIERLPNDNGIILRLGVLADPGAVGYKVGHSRHMGFYIETGSRRFAAQPYLRPAVFNNGRRVVDMLTDGIGK